MGGIPGFFDGSVEQLLWVCDVQGNLVKPDAQLPAASKSSHFVCARSPPGAVRCEDCRFSPESLVGSPLLDSDDSVRITGKHEVIRIGEFLTSLNPKLREGGFPDRRGQLQGKLALILHDLFPLHFPGNHVLGVIVHQKRTKPTLELLLKYWKHWRRGARVV